MVQNEQYSYERMNKILIENENLENLLMDKYGNPIHSMIFVYDYKNSVDGFVPFIEWDSIESIINQMNESNTYTEKLMEILSLVEKPMMTYAHVLTYTYDENPDFVYLYKLIEHQRWRNSFLSSDRYN